MQLCHWFSECLCEILGQLRETTDLCPFEFSKKHRVPFLEEGAKLERPPSSSRFSLSLSSRVLPQGRAWPLSPRW